MSYSRLEAITRLLHRSGARVGQLLTLELSQINQPQRKFQVVGKGNKQRWCFYSEDAEIALNKYIIFYIIAMQIQEHYSQPNTRQLK
ncbi:hypothetical protein [Nostoc sp. 'Peltigera membranacea cyanobiont' 232]|uniref:hypothetical protein n=1 Tax=Nostoc sp. 'Peltigera membranacea cyanobiont' 232 TaxID=2014531 RepID=UPI001CB89A3D|nr:hypothetical protein [Nostoc sp. 'Peltigera membranacea cyanobiont' 232]